MSSKSINNRSSVMPSGLTLIEFLVVSAIIAILVTLMFPAVRTSRGPARRTQCKNNLKQIGLALHNYYDTYGSFPPAYTVDENGNKLHSWRTLILPYIDQVLLYERIDLSKPWNDPANAEAFNQVLHVYQCPSANVPQSHTTYQAFVGDEAAFLPQEGRNISDIHDGTSNTALVIEVPAAKAVHWMAPEDFSLNGFLEYQSTETPHEGGEHVLWADGAVRFVSAEITSDQRRAVVTIDGEEEFSLE